MLRSLKSFVFFLSLLVPLTGIAYDMSFTLLFPYEDLITGKHNDFTELYLKETIPNFEIGAPMVPVKSISIVLPPNMRIDKIIVDTTESFVLDGSYIPYPVQPPVPIGYPQKKFVSPDNKFYSVIYPSQIVHFAHQGSMFGYNIASILIYPIQYEPEKKLRFHKMIRFVVTLRAEKLDCIRPNYSLKARLEVENKIKRIIFNPEDIKNYRP